MSDEKVLKYPNLIITGEPNYHSSVRDKSFFISLSDAIVDVLNSGMYEKYKFNNESIIFIYKYIKNELKIYATTSDLIKDNNKEDKYIRLRNYEYIMVNAEYNQKDKIWVPSEYRHVLRLNRHPNEIHHNLLWLKEYDTVKALNTFLDYKLSVMYKSKMRYENDKLQYEKLKEMIEKEEKYE